MTRYLSAAILAAATAQPALAATDTANGGAANATVTMSMTMGDSITLNVTGDVTGNTTLAIADTTLDFGNVYYGAIGPLGSAGQAYQNVLEENEYVIARFSLDVVVSGLLTGADMTVSEGAGAVYADATNTTAIVTSVGNITTPWAVDGTTGVLDVQTNPSLGTVLNLLPQSVEAGFRVARTATPGATSVPFVFTATPI